MTTLLLRAAVFLGSAALGLVAADLIVPGFRIVWSHWWGFVLCIVIFAVLQSVLAPVITRVARRHAPPLLGGVGLLSTFAALLIVVLLPIGGLRIADALAWALAPVVVWVVTAMATVLLPKLFIRRGADVRGDARRA
ncbi:hypothetical protein [Microbacterium sp. zg.Y909]|uniref:hypothetical protein n=1 Tax=Microbacterium sp. zg.Y909 TaxID=2969413 RepID=UPI00214CAFD5|nr:hypothetical protein [Microbacterium sp. zg.Y909]MCR2827289.1 hypothetical protein [Microbacterium sp. zg.Y909]